MLDRRADGGPAQAALLIVDIDDQLSRCHAVCKAHDARVAVQAAVGHEAGDQPGVQRAHVAHGVPDPVGALADGLFLSNRGHGNAPAPGMKSKERSWARRRARARRFRTPASCYRFAQMPIQALVLDTNIALDLLVFDDPACAPLREELADGELCWIATEPMRTELARVLGYPLIAARLARLARTPAQVLAGFDAQSRQVEAPGAAPCRCEDPDDQVFIDLAVAHRARLLSK